MYETDKQGRRRTKERETMLNSQCMLLGKGHLGTIWLAAYFYKKLKKAEVDHTDIPSSVDKILKDEFQVVTYRVLAYLLLGTVRVYAKKVEYLFEDCHEVLNNINDFVLNTKDNVRIETLRAPYFSITLPERFELDAFDLGILEDISDGNVLPQEEITLKDSAWKIEASGHFPLDEYHCEDSIAGHGTGSIEYTPNVNDSSRLMEIDMRDGISYSLGNLEASVEKLRDSRFPQKGCMNFEAVHMVEEEPPDATEPCGADHQPEEEYMKVPELENSENEIYGITSMENLQDNSFTEDSCESLEMLRGYGDVNLGLVKQSGKHHKADTAQSDNQVQQLITEDHHLSNVLASIEKLKDNLISMEELDDNFLHGPEDKVLAPVQPSGTKHESDTEQKLLESVQPFGTKHGSDTEQKSTQTLKNIKSQVITKDPQMSITLDATPHSDFPVAEGDPPELIGIPTPAAREQAPTFRKRKPVIDDVVVFPNIAIKESIGDSSDLVIKRKKVPRTPLAVWKAQTSTNLRRCFLESSVSCTSELRHLFCGTKLKVPELIETARGLEDLDMAETPTVIRSIQIVECQEKLEEPVPDTISRSVHIVECPEPLALDVPERDTVGRLVQTVEPPERLEVSESYTAGSPLEQTVFAPGTPVRQTSSSRSLEFFEREPSSPKDQVLDLNSMDEEFGTCEGDDEEYLGLSERTRLAAEYLDESFLNAKQRRVEEVVDLLPLLKGRTKRDSAKFFYEVLVMTSEGCVEVRQDNAYGDIHISKASQWEQICGTDSMRNHGQDF
ncbi:sister chromatid cohesion 1 protein 2 [Tripterygium wilfordii]|uniref:sister chromatid cohesion 1 protein 2 n=1 Tax=Tripterygium wilfordii TaxID=458696 RepID=UPI0018F84A3D|nr:sister chromatid cohesion 1 protein 2 [Tripterygium wilfordii]